MSAFDPIRCEYYFPCEHENTGWTLTDLLINKIQYSLAQHVFSNYEASKELSALVL